MITSISGCSVSSTAMLGLCVTTVHFKSAGKWRASWTAVVPPSMIQTGQVVFIDGGTTAVQLARHLPADLKCTVVTHSPSIAVELTEHPLIDVIMIGGRLFKHSIVAMGPAALDAIAQIRTDIYFMGVCSLHPEQGISTGDYDEAGVKRAIAAAAQKTVVLASPEKLDTASPFQIAPMQSVAAIIVNAGVPEALLAPYRNMGIEVVLAG